MSKRKFDASDPFDTVNVARKYQKRPVQGKKHTLDSDEEDFQDDDNVLDENEIEGEEDGTITEDGEQRMTAFNMQEEMELGHFDKDGHFIWKNEKEVRDNWLDNIDWQQIKRNANIESLEKSEMRGLGEESDSEDDDGERFDEIKTYKLILTYLKPTETISKALRRLGGNTEKLSSIERLKRKKAGTLNTNKEVTELTELSNKILNNLGNMDVYQESYEFISSKIERVEKKNKSKKEPELDMYSDNFDDKEKEKLGGNKNIDERNPDLDGKDDHVAKVLMWEFKRDQNKDEIEGPFTSEEMLKWSEDGTFKNGVFVRKCGESGNFYSSNRIDFDLYI